MILDFENKSYMTEYGWFLDNLGCYDSKNPIDITYQEFGTNSCFFAYDLSPELCNLYHQHGNQTGMFDFDVGFKTALEARGNSKVYINDLNSDSAPGYAIANIRAGFEQNYSNWKLNEFTRIENIFDKDYIGSVRVNDSSQRNFEPSAGRNYLLGFSATYQFK